MPNDLGTANVHVNSTAYRLYAETAMRSTKIVHVLCPDTINRTCLIKFKFFFSVPVLKSLARLKTVFP